MNVLHYYASTYYLDQSRLAIRAQTSTPLGPAEHEALVKKLPILLGESSRRPPCAEQRKVEMALGLGQNMQCAFDDTALVALAVYMEEYTKRLVNPHMQEEPQPVKGLRKALKEEYPRPRKCRRAEKAHYAEALADRLRRDAPNSSDNIVVNRNFSRIAVVPRAAQYRASRYADA